jgi:hypothetical protein
VYQDLSSLFADSSHLSLGGDIDFGLHQIVPPPDRTLDHTVMADQNGGLIGAMRHSLPRLLAYLESQPEVPGSIPDSSAPTYTCLFLSGTPGLRFKTIHNITLRATED